MTGSTRSLNKAAEGVNKQLGAVDEIQDIHNISGWIISTKPKDAKGQFYVTLQPKPDKYPIFGIVGDPVAWNVTTTTTTTNGSTVTEEQRKRKIEFTAQFAKRFRDLALRIGLTENT